jgi:hypothetical protein
MLNIEPTGFSSAGPKAWRVRVTSSLVLFLGTRTSRSAAAMAATSTPSATGSSGVVPIIGCIRARDVAMEPWHCTCDWAKVLPCADLGRITGRIERNKEQR